MELTENMFPSNLIHPGEYIKDEILSRGITQRQLAEKIGMQPSILNEIINGKRSVNIEFAMLLEAALGLMLTFGSVFKIFIINRRHE